jgi:hypothetical protein
MNVFIVSPVEIENRIVNLRVIHLLTFQLFLSGSHTDFFSEREKPESGLFSYFQNWEGILFLSS